MIILAIYAVFVWYLTLRYRRQWRGFVSLALGVLVLWLGVRLLNAGDDRARGVTRSHQMLTLLWAEMFIVAGVGLFTVCLPRKRKEMDCFGCGYDLSGLDPRELTCPECARRWTGLGSGLADDASIVKLTPMPSRPAGTNRARSRGI